MNKKFLSLVLALVMVLGTFGNVFAAAAPEKKEVKEAPKLTATDAKVKWLIDNSIVIGTADKDGKPTGDMDLKSPIRRDAVAKMLVYAIGEQDLAAKLQGVYRPFPDVETTNIMNGYIATAASRTSVNGVAIINGYEDGMFRPTNNVTYAELAKMLVVAIDKDLTPAVAKTYSWPQSWMDRAVRLGIFDGLSVDKANAPAVRSDAFAMIYNAFFKMKELKAVPSNEFRGIISERSNGTKLVLNQGEFKKEFKVNESTVFVRENGGKGSPSPWLKSFNSSYFVGSLVRVLFDKDGVATHIIEMGNPDKLAQNKDYAWVDLGKVQLKTDQTQVGEVRGVANTLEKVQLQDGKLHFEGLATTPKAIAPRDYFVTSKTVFYVADENNGILTQVKDYAAAKELVGDVTKRVYLGYEHLQVTGNNEAKVVVFNVAKGDDSANIVRVASAVSGPDYKLFVQASGPVSTALQDISKRNDDKNWPYNYGVVADDVIKVTKANKIVVDPITKKVVKLIDAENDPVVTVGKLLKYEDGKKKEVATLAEANAIELVDKTKMAAIYDLPTDFDAFFGKAIVKGAKVQFHLDGLKIDVLSVVSRAEDGVLTAGKIYDTRVKTGIVEKINAQQGLIKRIFIRVENEGLLEYVTTDDGFNVGDKVDYRVTGFSTVDTKPEVVLAKVVTTAKEFYDKALADVPAKDKITNADVTDVPALKAQLEKVIALYDNLKQDDKAAVKADLNERIAEYNKLAKVVADKANLELKEVK